MGLGGRLCTASEKKKRCNYPESCNYRVGAGGGVGIGRSGHTFRQRGKKKNEMFLLENNRHKHLVGFITKPILRR